MSVFQFQRIGLITIVLFCDFYNGSIALSLESRRVAESNFVFTGKLYDILKDEQRSIVFSPIGFIIQLIGLRDGAGPGGTTDAVLKSGLEFHGIDEATLTKGIDHIVGSFKDPLSIQFQSGQAFVLPSNISILPEYINRMRQRFNMSVFQGNYSNPYTISRDINLWARTVLNDTVSPHKTLPLASSRLFTQNSSGISFSVSSFIGPWKKKFGFSSTRVGQFFLDDNRRMSVDMMYQDEYFPHSYIPELDASAIFHLFRFGLVILLPSSRTGLGHLESKLIEYPISQIPRRLQRKWIELWLPKFKLDLTGDYLENRVLEKLRMGSISYHSADFTRISCSNDASCSGLIHRASIEINEEGAGGLGPTIPRVHRLASPPIPARFNVEHPFMFFIYDQLTKSVLIMGRKSKSFGTPNAIAQERVYKEALVNAKVKPQDVTYVEAHGTGTLVGDPIEVYAIAQAYSAPRETPLLISSVKPNIGHAEAAAGIASITKILMCFKHKQIPRHRNFKTLNPRIDLDRIPARIPFELTDWKVENGKRRLAGVSSFSLSGTNVHVILQEPPKIIRQEHFEMQMTNEPYAITLSAKSDLALDQLRHSYIKYLAENPTVDIGNIAYITNKCRAHLPYRIGVVAKSTAQLMQRLEKQNYVNGKVLTVQSEIAFIFTGQGSQYVGMGKKLYETFPAFQKCMDDCDLAFRKSLNESLFRVIWGETELLKKTIFCQPSIFCIEYCLYELWKSFGIVPDYVLGHSVGEYAAAVAAGVLSFEDAMKLVSTRSCLIETLNPGSMLALRGEAEKMINLVRNYNVEHGEFQVDIAAINAPEEIVISGSEDSIKNFIEKRPMVKCVSVPASHAFHSKDMDGIMDDFLRSIGTIKISPPKIKYVSGTLARILESELDFGPEYWKRHLRDTVRFSESFNFLLSQGNCKAYIEIGAQPILLGLVLANTSEKLILCPSIRKNENDAECFMGSFCKVYANGVNIDWSCFGKDKVKPKLQLPLYPFQRQKHWGIPDDRDGFHTPIVHPLLGSKFPSPVSEYIYCQRYDTNELEYMLDHRVADRVIVPAAAFLETALAAGIQILGTSTAHIPIVINNLSIEAAMELTNPVNVQTVIQASNPDESGNNEREFKMTINRHVPKNDSWKRHASSTISLDSGLRPRDTSVDIQLLKSELEFQGNKLDKVYDKIAEIGIQFGEKFRSIKDIWVGENGQVLARITNYKGDSYTCHPIVLDAMLQACAFKEYIEREEKTKDLLLPISIDKFVWYAQQDINCDSELYALTNFNTLSVNLYNSEGCLLATLEGLQVIRTTIDSVIRTLRSSDSLGLDFTTLSWISKNCITNQRLDLESLLMPSIESSTVAKVLEESKVEGIEETFKELEELQLFYLIRAVRECYWPWGRIGENFEAKSWKNILPSSLNPRLVDNFLNEMCKFSYLKCNNFQNGQFTILKEIEQIPQCEVRIAELLESLAKKSSDISIEFTKRVGELLPSVLQSKITGINMLFPEDENEIGAIQLYSQSYWYLKISEAGTALLIDSLPPKKDEDNNTSSVNPPIIRILEVGAGSGISSLHITNTLKEQKIPFEFTFTDISPYFLIEAEKKLGNGPEMVFDVLNIEQDPLAQGYAPEYYDFIFAMQVIHATKDIKESLRNLNILLKPGGRIILAEQFISLSFISFPFGTLDGWWRFTDFRNLSPIIVVDEWVKCLGECGYAQTVPIRMYSGMFGNICSQKINTPNMPKPIDSKPRTWIIVNDGSELCSSIIEELKQRNRLVITIGISTRKTKNTHTINPANQNEFFEISKRYLDVTEGIVFAYTEESYFEKDIKNSQFKIIRPLLYISQAYASTKVKLFLISRGLHYIGDAGPGSPNCGTAFGLLKTFSNENPELVISMIDLDQGKITAYEKMQVTSELWQTNKNTKDRFISYRGDKKYVQRLVPIRLHEPPLQLPNAQRLKFRVPESGAFSDIEMVPAQEFTVDELEEHKVEVRIVCTGLSFRDLFIVMRPEGFNIPKEHEGTVGIDISGTVVRVGSKVERVKPGDDIYGFTAFGLASHAIIPETLVMLKPPTMAFEEACTLPFPLLTSYLALITIAKLQPKEKVLIHAASGGVGLTAIQVAQRIGAEIFATAGTKRKRAYLKLIGVQHVYHSRNTDYGEEILKDTNGYGVDVVLNSLTGPNFKEATLDACAKYARFIEIGKLNIWQKEDVEERRKDVEYTILDLASYDYSDENVALNESLALAHILRQIESDVLEGIYRGLPYTRFQLDQVRSAFYFFQKAKHIGKVVVKMPKPIIDKNSLKLIFKYNIFNDNSTYLITGGLGGLGLEVTKWMLSNGAKTIVLVNRKPPTMNAESLISTWNKQYNSNIITLQMDIGIRENCVNLLKEIANLGLPPLRGIMHAAGVLSDNFVPKQDWESMNYVYNSKVYGGWYLHELTLDYSLEFFVMFSSMTAIFALMGQSNHVGANIFLDSLAYLRHEMGLKATTINWGAWSDIGAAAHISIGQEGIVGLRAITPAAGIASLDQIMKSTATQICPFDVSDWGLIKQIFFKLDTYLEEMTSSSNTQFNNQADWAAMIKEIQASPNEEREEKVQHFIQTMLKQTLKLPESSVIDLDQNFHNIGVDSLMEMEMINRIQGVIGKNKLSVSQLQENRTTRSLSRYLANVLSEEDGSGGPCMEQQSKAANGGESNLSVKSEVVNGGIEFIEQNTNSLAKT